MKKMRILFVDDEPKVLKGIERMLRPMRREWDVETVIGGEEALETLSQSSFDVVVSDMRMPGMDGAELLVKVRNQYPHIVRFVLSGQADEETILRSIDPTHQFLSKPCDPEVLISAITRAMKLRGVLNDEALKGVISQMPSLPSLPSLYAEVMEEVQSEDASTQKIGDIISQDVGMTAKILQLVNSSFFGLRGRISNPAQAVGLLGFEIVKVLILSIHIFSQFKQSALLNSYIQTLWDHSLIVSQYAELIAKAEKDDPKLTEEALLAGLLHDAGKVVLAANFPESYQDVLAHSRSKKVSIGEIEHPMFGASHTEVGQYLLMLWGFADPIIQAVAFHNQPAKCSDRKFSAITAVHVANAFDHEERLEEEGGHAPQIDTDYLAELGLSDRLPIWREICQSVTQSRDQE